MVQKNPPSDPVVAPIRTCYRRLQTTRAQPAVPVVAQHKPPPLEPRLQRRHIIAGHSSPGRNRQRRARALLCSCGEEERENVIGAMGARTRYDAWSYSAAAARMAGDADPPGFAAYPRGRAAAWGSCSTAHSQPSAI
jgi:hypothetical protein